MRLQKQIRVGLAVGAVLMLAAPARALDGDCNGDGVVRISELVTAVSIALGDAPVTRCAAADTDNSGTVSIDELIRAVAAAIAPPSTPTPIPVTPSASPTPPFVIITLGVAGGQPCDSTQTTFTIPGDVGVTVNGLRIEFCVDADSFDVAAVTCSSFSPTVAFDSIERRADCRLDDPVAPSGQVSVQAHGTGGSSGDAFEPFDPIECRIPVFADTEGGDYPVRYRVVAETSAGEVANAGEDTITVFGLPPTGRFQGACCSADTQCESGFCRAGDASQPSACCENDCPTGVCNSVSFTGSCCAATGLPDTCDPPEF